MNEYRLIGPPGTGKTTWIGNRVMKEAEARGAEKILLTSLTQAAAREIVSRNLPIPKESIGTLHSICFEATGRPIIADTKRADFNRRNPRYALTTDGRGVDDMGEPGDAAAPGDDLFSRYSLYRSKMIPRNKWQPSVVTFADCWERWKGEAGFQDFTDLIENALDRIVVAPGSPEVIFADEAQDYDTLELALLRKWGNHAEKLILVGDPDQAIFEWRGADPLAFQQPPVPDAQRGVLSKSYRIPRAVQRVAAEWIARIPGRENITYAPKEEEGEVRRLRATYKRPDRMVEEIGNALNKSDGWKCMVIAASAYMLEPFLRQLRMAGIPYHNPYRKKSGHWNPLRGHADSTSAVDRVLSFLRPSPEAWGENAHLWDHCDLYAWTHALTVEGTMHRGAKALFASTGEENAFILRSEQLLEFFEESAVRRMVKLDLEWYREHLLPARRPHYEFPINVALKRGHGELRKEPRVTVGTIHSVKGGEADTVYLMPDLSPTSNAQWNAPGFMRDAIRRLFYVGITRAEKSLVLLEPAAQYRVSGLAPGI